MAKALWVLKLPSDCKILIKKAEKVSVCQELAKAEKGNFQSPVDGLVSEVEKNKIVIEFKTEKINGRTYGQGRKWGQLTFIDGDFLNLNSSLAGKIVFVEKVDGLFLIKAEALGLNGIVCYSCVLEEKKEEVLPVLIIENDKDTIDMLKRSSEINCLVDTNAGCIFIPKIKK